MKPTLKAIVLSILFTSVSTSEAAILSGFNFPQGDGELFISIASASGSMIVDTDISLFGLRNGSVTSWSSTAPQTAAIMTFLSTAPLSEFRFNAGGVTGQADYLDPASNDDYGFFLTSNNPMNTSLVPLDSSGFNTVSSYIDTYIVQINNAYPSTEAITGLHYGEPGYHNQPNLWANNVGGTVSSISTEGSVGTPLNLWTGYNNFPGLFEYELAFRLLGQLNIDTSTGVANLTTVSSAVPVPAAVWLFGSGLVGLVGITRRAMRA